jgi:general secretion pathway protein H
MTLRTEPRDAGFTLIELLVVIAILGISAALLLARGPARSPGFEVRAAASDVAETLRLGRSRAIATDRPVVVMLDLPSHRMALDGVPRPAFPGWIPLSVRMADGGVPRHAAFNFAPDGSATGGAIAVGVPGRRILIAVDWLTGRIDIADGH